MGQKPIEGSNPSLSARRFESLDGQLSGPVVEKGTWAREGDAGSEAEGGPEAERRDEQPLGCQQSFPLRQLMNGRPGNRAAGDDFCSKMRP
jgi:hypothetical protein